MVWRYSSLVASFLRSLGDPKAMWSRLRAAYWKRAYGKRLPAKPEFLGDLLRAEPIPAGMDLYCAGGVLRVEVTTEGVARVRLARSGTFPRYHSYAVVDAQISHGESALPARPEIKTPFRLKGPGVIVEVTPRPCRLAFYDPAGHRLITDAGGAGWDGDGVICSHRLPGDRAIYGLGEKAFGLNHHGRRLVMWNTDQVTGYRPRTDPIYESVPFLVGHQDGTAHGLFFDNTYHSEFDLGESDPNQLCYRADGGELCYYVMAGPEIADVVARYTGLTGRIALPPRWALGYHQSRWSYESAEQVRAVAGELRKRQIPCDAIHLDIDYMEGYRVFTCDRTRFPDFAGLMAELRATGFHPVTIIDPGVKIDSDYFVCAEGLARDAFCKLPDGGYFTGPVWPGECYFPDFTNAAVRTWWGDLYKVLLDAEVAGFWNDMNEPAVFPGVTFPDAVQHNADPGPTDHRALHNVYGQFMVQACVEGLRRHRPDERPFVISRSAYAGIQRYAMNWTGDNQSTWAHLRLCIPMVLNMGLSGQSFAGPDVGGFGGDCDGELLARWMEVGAFMPFFRNHNAIGQHPQEPYAFGEPFESVCRRYIEWRYRLLPYLYTAFWQAAQDGVPVARPLIYAFPADRRAMSLDDEYLFGGALLVAPVLAPGSLGRGVYLPAGGWYDFWGGERFEGPNDVPAHAPLDVLPLYARSGSTVPVGPVMQHTDQFIPETVELHVFPGDGLSLLYEDDGRSLAYQQGEWRVTRFVVHQTATAVSIERASDGPYAPGYPSYDVVLRSREAYTVQEQRGRDAVRVIVDGEPAPAWSVDAGWQAIRIPAGLFSQVEVRWA